MDVAAELRERFPDVTFTDQETKDGIPTLWVESARVRDVLAYLKRDAERPYRMLYDLTAVDERARRVPAKQPECDFSVGYHLLSFDRNADIRLKVPLQGEYPSTPTIVDLWPNANWYEREVWDQFGIKIEGHPCLRRILNPPDWVGHPLRKEYPARATDMPGYTLPEDKQADEEQELQFDPESWGLARSDEDTDYMFLNLGPHHPGTHGLLRLILQLDGEEIAGSVVDIGWHHRGAEKMAERQTFHTYIPYTDRIDYLSGVQNNLPYVLTVEAWPA